MHTIERTIDGFRVSFDTGETFDFGRIRDHGQYTRSEVAASIEGPIMTGLIYRGNLTLLAPTPHRTFVKLLESRTEDLEIDWDAKLGVAENAVIDKLREGISPTTIGDKNPVPPTYKLWPFLLDGQVTTFFGLGGSLKSYLGALCGLMIQSGSPRFGFRVTKGNVMYLDWETSPEELNWRVQLLKVGLGFPYDLAFHYQYRDRHLSDTVPELLRYIMAQRIDTVIIDSVGAALGGKSSDDDVVQDFFNAVRSLRVTVLLIDHPSKERVDGPKSPLGSVQKTNRSRSEWEVRSKRGFDPRVHDMGLFHRKVNNGPLQPPMGLRFTFVGDHEHDPDMLTVEREDIRRTPALVAEMSVRQRILAALMENRGIPIPLSELCLLLDPTPKNQVIARLTELRNAKKLVELNMGWALLSEADDSLGTN